MGEKPNIHDQPLWRMPFRYIALPYSLLQHKRYLTLRLLSYSGCCDGNIQASHALLRGMGEPGTGFDYGTAHAHEK